MAKKNLSNKHEIENVECLYKSNQLTHYTHEFLSF